MRKQRGIGGKKKKVAPIPVPTFEHDQLLPLLNKQYQSLDGTKESQIYSKNGPYPHINLPNFFDDNFMEELKQELLGERYWQKNNDLFQFLQTKDLKKNPKDNISKLRSLLYGDYMRAFIEKVTGLDQRGLKLSSTEIDMSAACYRDTDHLLCHDDELEGRRIAYIIYFVPRDWTAQDGGTLDLFDVDDQLQPRDIVTQLVPAWNSITFFEVNPVSYHQVAQVLRDEEKCEDRISVSGWYYCDVPIERPEPYIETPIEMKELVELDKENDLREWINETYFNEDNRAKIVESFAENSSIELVDFIRKDKLVQLAAELKQTKWKTVGPANRRHYGAWEGQGSLIQGINKVFQSQEMAKFLTQLTQHEILKQNVKTRKFDNNCYTLVHDASADVAGLDVALCLLVPKQDDVPVGWNVSHGGIFVYMSEDEELLSVFPVHNSLSIVLREPTVMQFVKFVNHRATGTRYDICCTYAVPELEEPSWEDASEEDEDVDEEDDE